MFYIFKYMRGAILNIFESDSGIYPPGYIDYGYGPAFYQQFRKFILRWLMSLEISFFVKSTKEIKFLFLSFLFWLHFELDVFMATLI